MTQSSLGRSLFIKVSAAFFWNWAWHVSRERKDSRANTIYRYRTHIDINAKHWNSSGTDSATVPSKWLFDWLIDWLISGWQQSCSVAASLQLLRRAPCERVRSCDETAASVQRCVARRRPAADRAWRPYHRHWSGTKTETCREGCAGTCARKRHRRRN